MSKTSGRLVNRYASSLLKAASKITFSNAAAGVTPAQFIAMELSSFKSIWQNSPDVVSAMSNPMFETEQRFKALKKITKAGNLTEISEKFIEVCFLRDRISLLTQIIDAFVVLADKQAGIVKVEVVTAAAVLEDEKKRIEEGIKNQVTGKPVYNWVIDSSIIGGMIIRYEGKAIDGSITGRISRLENQLFNLHINK